MTTSANREHLWQQADGKTIQQLARTGELRGPTAGLARGFVQANLVVLPLEMAFEFFLFCHRNPKPCPVLDVTEPGNFCPVVVAPDADLRTDLPAYCVYRNGELVEETDTLLSHWQSDFVAFLLGCSFTFENALLQVGLPVRHLEQGCNVPMYKTNLPCQPAGQFHGSMVVSMRPLRPEQTIQAVDICRNFSRAHGTPVHFGNPEAIGITDLSRPDYGDPVSIHPDEVPVFWACGVTPQYIAQQAGLPLLITHKPGHMFVTDVLDLDICD